MHDFTNLLTDRPICSARLTVHLKALPDYSANDGLGFGQVAGAESWSANIGSLHNPPCSWGAPGCTEMTLQFDLSTLLLRDDSGTVLDYIKRHGELPFTMQDDTMMDYMTLDVCHCGPPVTCVIEPPNMTHWYPFDATSIPLNSPALEIIGGRNGTHQGLAAPLLGQKVANSVTLGPNKWIAVSAAWYRAPNYGMNDDFSIDAWVKTSQTQGTQVLVDKRSYAPVGYALDITNGFLRFHLNSTVYASTVANPVITDGNWQMVAVTVKRNNFGSGIKGVLYVDGVPVHTFTPLTGFIGNGVLLWMGRGHLIAGSLKPYGWLNGSLDEVEFFNRALTAQEIFDLYKAQSAGKCKAIHNPPVPTPTPGRCTWCGTDVAFNSTFYPYVSTLLSLNVVSGYACGSNPNEPCMPSTNYPYYRPGADITRGQVAKIVALSAGFNDDPGEQLFTDVPPTSPFYAYINPLARRGIVSGYPCGGANEPCDAQSQPYFRPGNNVTRGQLAKIAGNAAGLTDPTTGQTFADVSPTHPFYLWIENMAAQGVISGYADGTFRPGNNVTRGQGAKIIANTFYPDGWIEP